MSVAARLATEDPAVVFAAIRRGVRRSVTKQARAYRPLQQEAGEKCGLRKVSGATRQRAEAFGEGTSHKMDPPVGGNVEHPTFNIEHRTMGMKNAHSTSDLFHLALEAVSLPRAEARGCWSILGQLSTPDGDVRSSSFGSGIQRRSGTIMEETWIDEARDEGWDKVLGGDFGKIDKAPD